MSNNEYLNTTISNNPLCIMGVVLDCHTFVTRVAREKKDRGTLMLNYTHHGTQGGNRKWV